MLPTGDTNQRKQLYFVDEMAVHQRIGHDFSTKGQIISECPYEIIVWTKIPTKKLPRFLPKPLRRGQIKNFIKPIMLNNP